MIIILLLNAEILFSVVEIAEKIIAAEVEKNILILLKGEQNKLLFPVS